MALDRTKLHDLLAGLRSDGSGAANIYGGYLDRLPSLFGSAKLGDEADLILAALAAAERACAMAAEAVAPVEFELDGEDADGAPLFRPSATAPVGGLENDWMGAPLYAIASALGRAKERQSVDDEVYSASFVYVLFRLKAALGVWRGDASQDARYRLWLKDLAPVIAAHPRLGPKVVACHERIARAVFEACETYLPALQAGERVEAPPVFAAFATSAFQHATAGGIVDLEAFLLLHETLRKAASAANDQGLSGRSVSLYSAQIALWGNLPLFSIDLYEGFASAYMNRGVAKGDADKYGPAAAIVDYDRTVALREILRGLLEPRGAWDPEFRDGLASAYMNRGAAKLRAGDHGTAAAIVDVDRAIVVWEGLRELLEPGGAWDPKFRDHLSGAYMNRGVAKRVAEGYGPASAIADYDRAIAIREEMRGALEPRGMWNPELRDSLARAYENRGVAKHDAEGYGPASAIADYDRAIAVREEMRGALEFAGAWDPIFRDGLASSYKSRGNAKQRTGDHGPVAAIADYDLAIVVWEALRGALEPRGAWAPEFRDHLAGAYMNRGVAKQVAEDHGPVAAIADYDRAIVGWEGLREVLEARGAWDPKYRDGLADAHMNRGNARLHAEGYGRAAAIADYDQAILLREELRRLLEPRGAWDPEFRDRLASVYMNRGSAKQGAEDYGPVAAIADYDHAIILREALQGSLEPRGAWDPEFRDNLANAYMNRANSKQGAADHGPAAAIADFDRAIAVQEGLRAVLEPRDAWEPELREGLATAYMNRGSAKREAGDHGPAAAIADYDRAIVLREGLRGLLEPRGSWDPMFRAGLGGTYLNRGNAKAQAGDQGPAAAILDYDRAIVLLESLKGSMEPRDAWDPQLANGLASAYMNRGVAKRHAEGYGPATAIADYDRAIALREALRASLESRGEWDPELRDHLASAYMNRGYAKSQVSEDGSAAAIADYDLAISLGEGLRRLLESRGAWDPGFRNGLAGAYMNRGVAKQGAEGYGPAAAIADYEQAIALREALRGLLEPRGAWDPEFRNELANGYMNRGNAKAQVGGQGMAAAIADLDEAVLIWEGLQELLEPRGAWDPRFRSGLGTAYMNRASAQSGDHRPAAAITDFDRAIVVLEALRGTLEPFGTWGPAFRAHLAGGYANRGLLWESLGNFEAACRDGRAASAIADQLVGANGATAPPLWRQFAQVAADLIRRTCTDRRVTAPPLWRRVARAAASLTQRIFKNREG